MEIKELQQKIQQQAKRMGASLCKVADLTLAKGFVAGEYGEELRTYPRAISIAVFYPKEIVQQQLDGPTRSYEYFYDVINARLDAIGISVSNMLQEAGYRSFPVPASDYREAHRIPGLQHRIREENMDAEYVSEIELRGVFGHRLAANLAGIGWVGKSRNIINPYVGPRLRLITVLTDAMLEADAPIENRCGSCRKCCDACPPGALKGDAFNPEEPLADAFDCNACNDQLTKMGEIFGAEICALCLAVCPWGK